MGMNTEHWTAKTDTFLFSDQSRYYLVIWRLECTINSLITIGQITGMNIDTHLWVLQQKIQIFKAICWEVSLLTHWPNIEITKQKCFLFLNKYFTVHLSYRLKAEMTTWGETMSPFPWRRARWTTSSRRLEPYKWRWICRFIKEVTKGLNWVLLKRWRRVLFQLIP